MDAAGGGGRRRVRGLEGWSVVGWAALLVALTTAGCLALHGTGALGWRHLIRGTARISGALLLAAFLAAPLMRLRPGPASAWLLRNRRALGVSVGVSHGMHAVAIAMYMRLTDFRPEPGALAAAGLAYVFLAAMVATSFDATARWLGRGAWRRLHRIGLYFLWGVFGSTFLGAGMAGDPVAAAFAVLFALALPLRLLGLRGRAR